MIGIVILNYNNSGQTKACLESLYSHCKSGNYKVCVVDNASRKQEAEKLGTACCRGEHVIYAGTNGGYARGNNLGCEYFAADPEVDKILVLNDDTRFTQDCLSEMEAYLDAHPECGVTFPLVKAPDGSVDRACLRRAKSKADLILQATSLGRFGVLRKEFLPLDTMAGTDSVVTEVPPGSCMMLPKGLFEKIGWLDPDTFLYFEEHILGARLRAEGKTCVLLPRTEIVHLGAGTTSRQSSKTIYRHWRDSYLYFLDNYTDMSCATKAFLRWRTGLKARF